MAGESGVALPSNIAGKETSEGGNMSSETKENKEAG